MRSIVVIFYRTNNEINNITFSLCPLKYVAWCASDVAISFIARSSYASAVLRVIILSVCTSVHLSVRLSVCHTRAMWQNQTTHCGYFDITRKGNHSSVLAPTMAGGRRLLPSEICVQIGPRPFEKRRLPQISDYNVSTVKDSDTSSITTNRKSTTGFPTSYRWSAYVTPKP